MLNRLDVREFCFDPGAALDPRVDTHCGILNT
jgi:hypothetical protein